MKRNDADLRVASSGPGSRDDRDHGVEATPNQESAVMTGSMKRLVLASPLLLLGACTSLSQDDRALLDSVRQTSLEAKSSADRANESAKAAADAAARAAATSAQGAEAARASAAAASSAAADAKAAAERADRMFQRAQRKPSR
jgi:hypothetical protein